MERLSVRSSVGLRGVNQFNNPSIVIVRKSRQRVKFKRVSMFLAPLDVISFAKSVASLEPLQTAGMPVHERAAARLVSTYGR